ncbi:MAG: ABC transporter permease, partial [Acidimicrobiales bacterium]
MTIVDDRPDGDGSTGDDAPEPNLAAPDTRAAGRWNSAGMPTERSARFGESVRRLTQLMGPERPVLVVVALASIASATLNVLGPRVLGRATDVIVAGITSPGGIDRGRLNSTLLQAVALYVGSALLSVLVAFLIAGVVQRLMHRLRTAAETKIHALTLRHIDQQSRGDLLSRVTNDLDNLAQSLQQTLSQMLTSVLLLLGVAAMMFVISPLLAVVALTTVPLSVWGMKKVAQRARPRYLAQWRSTGVLNGQIEETFTG